MLDYEKVTKNAIEFIKRMSKEEWIAFLEDGNYFQEDGDSEVHDLHQSERSLYGRKWHEKYNVHHDDSAELSQGSQEVQMDGYPYEETSRKAVEMAKNMSREDWIAFLRGVKEVDETEKTSMATTTMGIKLDAKLRCQLEDVSSSLGLTVNEVFNVFARQFVAHRGFPFAVIAPISTER